MLLESSECGFGLVFTAKDPESALFAKAVVDTLFDEGERWEAGLADMTDILNEDDGAGEFRYYDECCQGKCFEPTGEDKSLGAKETEELEMLVFLADRQPTAYALAYKDEEEVIAEFRRKLGKFLPDDFNYGARIGYFQSCVPFY